MTHPRQEPRKLRKWLHTRLIPRCAKLCALLGLVILALWITGRVLTDQYQWSQYLFWVPPLWILGSAWVLLIISAVLARFSRRLGGLFLRPVLLIANIGCSVYLLFGVWHLDRAIVPFAQHPDQIRVAHWNHAGSKIDEQKWASFVFDNNIDIVLLANAHWGDDRQFIFDALSPYAPGDTHRWVNYSYKVQGDPAHFWTQDGAVIASRFPMIRTGIVKFGNAQRQKLLNHSSSNLGWVMFIEFDISEEIIVDGDVVGNTSSEPFVVWFVDLPSDPYNSRLTIMKTARQETEHWNGKGWKTGRHTWEQTEQEPTAFPDPDLIIGDFNTPQGSRSLDEIAPNMTDAYQARGFGRTRSWKPPTKNKYLRQAFKLVDFHIDLSLVGPGWKTAGYRIKNTSPWGFTAHQMQIIDLRPTID